MLTNTEVWAAAAFKFDTIQARPLFFLLEWVKKKTKEALFAGWVVGGFCLCINVNRLRMPILNVDSFVHSNSLR